MTKRSNSESDLRELAKLCDEFNDLHGRDLALLCKRHWINSMQTELGKKICGSMLEQIGGRRARIWELEHENKKLEQVAFGLRDDMHALTDVILGGQNSE